MTGASVAEDGPDEEERLRQRLAALDALRGSGELSEEEYAVARRLAILSPVERPKATAAPQSAPHAPVAPAAEAPRRRWVWSSIAAAVAMLLVAGVVIWAFAGGSSSSSSGGQAAGSVRVNKSLVALFTGAGSGRCFGPRAGASFKVYGDRRTSDFLNCGDDDPALATGSYTFASLPNGTIKTFSAVFAIDEGSYRAQTGSTAHFMVTYGGRTICDVSVRWGSPQQCRRTNLRIPTSAGSLTITQDVQPATYRSTAGLWAGLVGGRIGITVPRG